VLWREKGGNALSFKDGDAEGDVTSVLAAKIVPSCR